MPGSGKTTAGALLAQKLNYPFYDLDDLVVSQEQNTIANIFAEKGESYFRLAEQSALENFIHSNAGAPYVLALGGGTPCYSDNTGLVKQHGILVYLQCPVNELAHRLQNTAGERPLLQGMDLQDKLIALQIARNAFYMQSHYTVNATGTPQEVADMIAQRIA